jgi:cation:H+ antiporter
MDIPGLLTALAMVAGAMYVIKYACDSFEGASAHLGKKVYKMGPGIRGATIEAIASSLPELFTASFLLFLYNDQDGFSAGIATCAGSAVFNAAVIPAVCVVAVTTRGVNGKPVPEVPLLRSTILRDGLFFLIAEFTLIYFLGSTLLAWWMGAVLIGIYLFYFGVLSRGFGTGDDGEDEEDEEDEEDDNNQKGLIGQLFTFDYNELVFGGRDFTARSAWVVLVLATATIGLACYFLADAVIISAQALGVPAYFTAVILGAAATSVPDTFISYADAMKGDYDDAIANAVGSNIFDICVAIGLPLLAYGLIYGDVSLNGSIAAEGASANVQELRIALVLVTFVILGILLSGKKGEDDHGEATISISKGGGWILGSLYVVWTVFIVGRAMEWSWLENLLG